MTVDEWNSGQECDRHTMAWCAYCNPNESSFDQTPAKKATSAKPKA